MNAKNIPEEVFLSYAPEDEALCKELRLPEALAGGLSAFFKYFTYLRFLPTWDNLLSWLH